MKQEQAEKIMRRYAGPSAETMKAAHEVNDKASDWFGFCRLCGKRREGTLEDLNKPCDCHGK